MNKCWLLLLAPLLAGWALNASAQNVWTYVLIAPNAETKVTFKPPFDLTYPKPGTPMPVVYSDAEAIARGVPLTAQEVAERRSAPQLIITLVPLGQAQHILSGGRF